MLDEIIFSLNEEIEMRGLESKYSLHHSTISDYFHDVFSDAKSLEIEWEQYDGDFWAYNYKSKPGAYWTGYFTTGIEIKSEIRQYSDFVRSATQLMSTFPIKISETDMIKG